MSKYVKEGEKYQVICVQVYSNDIQDTCKSLYLRDESMTIAEQIGKICEDIDKNFNDYGIPQFTSRMAHHDEVQHLL